MELNEMEKRLIFQTEGYGKSDVTYELRMCLPYIPDPVRRKTAAELVRKLDAMPEKDCLALIQDIRKNYQIPAGSKTMGELLAEARQKSGAEKLKGHDIMALERFDPEVKHIPAGYRCRRAVTAREGAGPPVLPIEPVLGSVLYPGQNHPCSAACAAP
ncbi:DUF5720 family protein [Acutalibacter caecimuris]|uniref:DUF5720 family protein n=1 Tax=Acutalibacter caecimuris TaxID=3093657 RepID=UPI003460DC44